jgi:hypothetical protein
MKREFMLLVLLTGAAVGAPRAQEFAPAGARASLIVQYRFESSGKIVGAGSSKYEVHEWRTLRTVDMTAELTAAKPLPMPSLQAPDAAATASAQRQNAQAQAKAQLAATPMAPMMASAEAIAARCGNDEKCIEREVMKMGAGMSATAQVDSALAAGRETVASIQPGANRYQVWRAVSQKGRYAIEGSARIVHADPGCMSLPQGRCRRDTQSKGEGDVPPVPGGRGGPAAAEVDTQAQTLTLQLPVPMGVLPYTDTVTSNEPKGTQEVPPGVHARQLKFVTTSDGKISADGPLSVPLKGGWRNQSGEQVVQVKGEGADGGTLTIRWRFSVQ